jgi:hypothetical protein
VWRPAAPALFAGLGRTDSETASNVLGGPDAKFGVSPDQIVAAYAAAREAGATRFGMHMMTGSCVLSNEYWVRGGGGFSGGGGGADGDARTAVQAGVQRRQFAQASIQLRGRHALDDASTLLRRHHLFASHQTPVRCNCNPPPG